MYDRLGKFVADHWLSVILAWLVLAAALSVLAPRWDDVAKDGDLAFLPVAMPSVRGEALLVRAFPQSRASSQMAIVFARPNEPLQPLDYQWANRLTDAFRKLQAANKLPLRDIWTVDTKVVGKMLHSRDRRAAIISLQMNTEFMATANIGVLQIVREQLQQAGKDRPEGLEVGITGSAAIGGDMLDSARESIANTERSTILLVIVILLLVYRAPLLVVVPLATIAISIQVALACVAMLTQVGTLGDFSWWHFQIFKTTKIFVVVILYGAGTDYCLFLIARFKQLLAAGATPTAAVGGALGGVGGALMASGSTTVLGLATMFFADFGKYSNSGPAIGICLTVTLLACLTFAPAALAGLGRWVFWPLALPGAQQRTETASPAIAVYENSNAPPNDAAPSVANRIWDAIARIILRRPGWILLGALLLTTPAALRGWKIDITYDLLGELQADRPSVQGTALLRKHFPPGETGPVTILVYRPSGGFDQPVGEIEIAGWTKQLYDLQDRAGEQIAASVRSFTEPMGDKPGYTQPFTSEGLLKMAAKKHPLTKARFVTQVPQLAGRVARFDLILRCDPFSAEAIDVVDQIETFTQQLADKHQRDVGEIEFLVTGTTAGLRDLQTVTEGDRRRIQQLVVIAVLAVLLLLLRRPVVCGYLILSVLWSYFVTIGIAQVFFAWLYGDTYFGLDWKVPLFLFVILIAVGEDYNIYLATRVFEEQRRHGLREGLRRGVASTGGIITSCGLIMAGTFVSMMTGSLRGMLELGFALSLGVLLDTFVVRTILVPAFLALLLPGKESNHAEAAADESKNS